MCISTNQSLFFAYLDAKLSDILVMTSKYYKRSSTGNSLPIHVLKAYSVSKLYKDSEFIEGTAKYEQFHERFMEEYNNYEKEYDYWTR